MQQVHGKLNDNLNGDYGNYNKQPIQQLFEDVDTEIEEIDKTSDDFVSSFMENYFGDSLSEDTSVEDILEAVYNLNYTCSHVNGFFNDYDEVDEDTVTEYFDSYFGDSLNEDTSEEDIIRAVELLNQTREQVNETFEIDEGLLGKIGKGLVVGGLGALAAKGAYHAYRGHKAKQKGHARDKRDANIMRRAKGRAEKKKAAGLKAVWKKDAPATSPAKPEPTAKPTAKPTVIPTAPRKPVPSANPNKNLPKPLIKK